MSRNTRWGLRWTRQPIVPYANSKSPSSSSWNVNTNSVSDASRIYGAPPRTGLTIARSRGVKGSSELCRSTELRDLGNHPAGDGVLNLATLQVQLQKYGSQKHDLISREEYLNYYNCVCSTTLLFFFYLPFFKIVCNLFYIMSGPRYVLSAHFRARKETCRKEKNPFRAKNKKKQETCVSFMVSISLKSTGSRWFFRFHRKRPYH